jgi:hypothetical protein
MALTQVPIELSSTPGIVDNSNATAITIDSSEQVGIGTSLPKTTLNLSANNSGQGPILTLENSDTSLTTNDVLGQIDFYGNDGSTGGTGQKATIQAFAENSSGTSVGLIFGTSPFPDTTATERARIDSSGNLLVGTTSANIYNTTGDDGVAIKTDNIQVQRANNETLFLNRTGTDGTIADFRKDGTSVGSIGAGSGDLNINGPANHSGIRFQASSILPRLNGADTDGTVDLGYDDGTSTHRWKDLYLSGGAYLGGTGAANKLDDYEEGTWTPVGQNINGSGYNIGVADYTKVGRLVSCDLRVQWTGTANTAASIGFTLPFQSDNTTGAARTGLVFFSGTQVFGDAAMSTHISNNGNVVSFYKTNGGNFQAVSSNQVNGSYDWLVSFTYFTA